jgi:hypothetical protein
MRNEIGKIFTKAETLAYIEANTIWDENGCRLWTGPVTKDGYAQVGINGIIKAFGIKGIHRLVVHLDTGHVFQGRQEQVLHSCDVRNCTAPAHLRVGTAAENLKEAADRDRVSHGDTHHHAKITSSIARTIKELIDYGYRNCYIGDTLGISRDTVSRIRNGKTWVRA